MGEPSQTSPPAGDQGAHSPKAASAHRTEARPEANRGEGAAQKDHGHPPAGEIERLKQEVKDAHDRYLRAAAEFENTKKRLSREKEEFAKYAAEAMVRELLPIVDSLDQALVAVDPSSRPERAKRVEGLARDSAHAGLRKQPDMEAILKGIQLIHRQLLDLLNREGVARIPTVGQPFDPHRHEAVAHVEGADGQPDGVIAEEVHVGYTMHGKVLRPAMVKITKKAADSNQQTAHSKEQSSKGGSGLGVEGSGQAPPPSTPHP